MRTVWLPHVCCPDLGGGGIVWSADGSHTLAHRVAVRDEERSVEKRIRLWETRVILLTD